MMISAKKLTKMARKWQKFAATQRKRISFHRNIENEDLDRCSSSSKADKGHFVVYSADQRRFEIPLNCLNNEIFIQLLKMSEEEFGLPSNGPIILPLDGQLMDYIISIIQRGLAGDLQKALLISVATSRCSLSSLHQECRNEQLLVC